VRGWRHALCALTLLMARPRGARADDPVTLAPAAARVEVTLAANPEAERLLAPVLSELIERLGLVLALHTVHAIEPFDVLNPKPRQAQALARVFVDAQRRDVALLYLVDAAWQRVLVRRISLAHGLDEVAREELAHIVESSVQALAVGGQIGVTRAEASADLGLPIVPNGAVVTPAPEPTAKPPPNEALPPQPRVATTSAREPRARALTALELRIGAGWGFASWTPQTPVHGPELQLDLSAGQRLSWGGALSAQYRLRRELHAEPIGVATRGVGLRLLGRMRYRSEPRLGFVAQAGGGLDYERFEPISGNTPDVTLDASASRTSFILASQLGIEAHLFGRAWLSLMCGAELDLAPDDYVVVHGTGIVPIAEPLRLRPTFSALLLLPL
jgi:hypothetical protein